MSWKLVVLPIALAVIFVVNFVASKYYPGGYLFAQAPTDTSASLINLSVLALLMFLGILSSFIFERAKQRSSDLESVWTNFSIVLTDFQFIAAVFVSPIIFNSIYSLVHQNPEGISDFLLAYQNGFFWQSVLAGVTPRRKPAPARTHR